MLDGHRSWRVGRTPALWIALLAGLIVWGLIEFMTPRGPAASQASEWNAADTAAPASLDTDLEIVGTPASRTSARDLSAVPVATPQPVTDRGSIRGQVRVVGAHAPASFDGFDGFARVTAFSASGAADVATFVALPVVRIAHDGTFVFSSVPLGEWIVSVEPDSCELAEARAVVSETALHPWVEITTVITEPQELTVVLLDSDGSPLAIPFEVVKSRVVGGFQPCFFERLPRVGANVQEGRLYPTLHTVRSDELGAWVVAKFPRACSGFAAVALGGYVVDAVPFARGQSLVTLRVDASRLGAVQAQVDVQVTDAVTGAPLSGATVRVGPAQSLNRAVVATLRPRTDLDIELNTDDRGVAKFVTAPVGPVDIQVERTGCVAERRLLELRPGRNPDCEIALARAFTIRGKLEQLEEGRLTVSASRMEEENGVRLITTSPCGADGGFTLTGLPAGEYAVGASFVLSTGVVRGLAEPVRAGRFPGYTYVDLRNGDVSGVVIPKLPEPTRR